MLSLGAKFFLSNHEEVNNPSDSNNPETTKPETAPATGDMTNMYFFVTTAMAAGALAVLLRKKRA